MDLKQTEEVIDLITTIDELVKEREETKTLQDAAIQKAIGNLKDHYATNGISPKNNDTCDHPYETNDGKGDMMCAVCERYTRGF